MNPVVGCHHTPPGPQRHTCIVMNPVVGCHHVPPGPQRHTCIVINPALGCHYFLPGPQLPLQPSGVTTLRPVPSYTAWWQRHTGVGNLPRVFTPWCPAETRTCNLLITSLTLYRNTMTLAVGRQTEISHSLSLQHASNMLPWRLSAERYHRFTYNE